MAPSGVDANDSDDDEFMEKVNVYLNTRDTSENDTSALESILRRSSSIKTVKFAIDEAEIEDAKRDGERSRQELLDKIARLTEMLKGAEDQIKLERDKRKKKEKVLMKLAKELKKRNAEKEIDMERMEELDEKKKYLEHHWILAQKELDQEKILRQKLQNETQVDFERTLKEEKDKYQKLDKDHDNRISQLKQAHAKQCDELCQEVLKANLEADRLHSQLTDSDITPRKARLFKKDEAKEGWASTVLLILSALFVVVVFFGLKVDMFTMDAVCGPVMPGRVLRSNISPSSFESPWWAPTSYKALAFEAACSKEEPPTILEWLPDGRENKLTVTRNEKATLTKRNVLKAEVYGDRLRLWNKKGVAEDHGSVWSV